MYHYSLSLHECTMEYNGDSLNNVAIVCLVVLYQMLCMVKNHKYRHSCLVRALHELTLCMVPYSLLAVFQITEGLGSKTRQSWQHDQTK